MGSMDGVPASQAFNRIQSFEPGLIVHARDIETLTVYEWDEDGVQQNAFGDQPVKVPAGAARIELQLYNFPTCQLRRIYFPKGTRTPWHPNHDDIILYSIDAHQVEFVNQQTFHARPGDMTLHPSGVDHHSETLVKGWRLEFAFEAQGRSGRDLVALPATDMRRHEVTEWIEADRRCEVIGPTTRTGNRYQAKLFHFPVYTLREQYFARGASLARHTNSAEQLLYVLEGRLRVTLDAVTDVLEPGSMARVPAGKAFAREALADSVVIELDGWTTPRPYPRRD